MIIINKYETKWRLDVNLFNAFLFFSLRERERRRKKKFYLKIKFFFWVSFQIIFLGFSAGWNFNSYLLKSPRAPFFSLSVSSSENGARWLKPLHTERERDGKRVWIEKKKSSSQPSRSKRGGSSLWSGVIHCSVCQMDSSFSSFFFFFFFFFLFFYGIHTHSKPHSLHFLIDEKRSWIQTLGKKGEDYIRFFSQTRDYPSFS